MNTITIHHSPNYTSFKAQNEQSKTTNQNKLKAKIIQNKNTTIAIGTGVTALAALGTYLITRGRNNQSIKNSMTNIAEKLINADTTLLPNTTKQPELLLDNITPESLVLVHMTDYFPTNGIISSVKQAIKDKNGISPCRSTVHFALNKSVSEHTFGNNWNTMKYAILMPFKSTIEKTPPKNIIGGITDDFFFMNEVPIPEGSVILKFNNKIPNGKLKISQATENGQILKGISLVETSNPQTGEVANLLTEKMGYTSYNNLFKKTIGVDDETYKIITSDYYKLNEEQQEKYLGLSMDIGPKVQEFTQKLANSWKNFTQKHNYTNGAHAYSPWGRSEHIIQAINLLKTSGNNSWEGKDYSGITVNYKDEFIKILNEIMDDLPKEKELSFDTNKLKAILKESPTPQEAEELIKTEMKLTPLQTKEQSQPAQEEAVYTSLDSLIGISEMQKTMIKQQNNTVQIPY